MDAHNNRQARRGLVVLVVLAVALVCGGTALAFSSGFYERAFGAKGHEDIPQHTETVAWIEKGVQLVETDPEQANRLLGDSVSSAGIVLEAGGYSLTIEDVVIDENDLGLATFTLACPNGTAPFIYARDRPSMVAEWTDEEGSTTDVYDDEGVWMELSSGAGMVTTGHMVSLWVERADQPCYLGGGSWNCDTAYATELDIDWDLASDDELRGTMYFCPTYGGKADDGAIRFHLAAFRGGFVEAVNATMRYLETGGDRSALEAIGLGDFDFSDSPWDDLSDQFLETSMSEPFLVDRTLGSLELLDDEGRSCRLSAIGVAFDKPADYYIGVPWYVEHMSVAYDDGGSYVVEDDRYRNFAASDYGSRSDWGDFTGVDGHCRVIFNRLVDPFTVSGITMNGAYRDETITYAPTQ